MEQPTLINEQIVMYSTEWCHSCKRLVDQWERVNQHIPIIKKTLDTDDDADIALMDTNKISKFPTFVHIKHGVESARHIGANVDTLNQWIESLQLIATDDF